MTDNRDKGTDRIEELQERIESLEIQLKHVSNDLKLTREEYDTSTREYFKIYTNMEELVNKRTGELEKSRKFLEQKGRELQVMLDSSPALIYYKDLNRRYIRVNKRFAETMGAPIQQIIGNTYRQIFPEQHEHGAATESRVIETGQSVLKEEQVLETRHGKRQILVDTVPYHSIDSEVIGVIGFAQDITDLKRAESEKETLENQLLQAQKLESIGVLAGGIAHDFNNIMAAISGAAQFLEMKIQDEGLSNYIEMINSSITRGRSITDRVLSFSRNDTPSFRAFSGIEYLESIKDIVGHTLSKDINITIDSQVGEATLYGDPSQLQQVILNLCINASDAMPNGGEIILTISHATETMVQKHNASTEYDYYCIAVSDTGTGMSPETQNRIFDPFFTTKEPGKGTGLGLTVAYRILQQHKGWITVDSHAGNGTTVTMGIPAASSSVETESIGRMSQDLNGSGEHILLVEDEAPLRSLMAERLRVHGYKVSVADDGRNAILKFLDTPGDIDIVVTDIKMPNMDGISLLRHIQQMNQSVPFIALTGLVDRNRVEESEEVRFDSLLQKPVEVPELLKTIKKILRSQVD